MSEVKWIKITTDMFEHEKLDFILSLPEADAIVIVWIRLLTLAGKVNAGGYVLLTENIAYTEDMLAHKFRKSPNVIKLALETLKRLKMIEMDGEAIRIANWEKHQNIDGMERIREQNRLRKQKERAAKKLLEVPENNSHVTVTGQSQQSHAIEVEEDKEKDINTTTTKPNPYRVFESEGFGTISPYIKDEIDELSKEYGDQWVCEGMKRAVFRGKRSMSYVKGILVNWKADGMDEPWKEEKADEQPRGRNQTVTPFRNARKSETLFPDSELDDIQREQAAMLGL